jgi:hypothetical protein
VSRRLPLAPDPDKDALERKGAYIVIGELLLTDYEWAGGITPNQRTLDKRRAEIGERDTSLDALFQGLADATGAKVLNCDGSNTEIRPRLELLAKAPIRAKVDQADMADTPLFGQGQLL